MDRSSCGPLAHQDSVQDGRQIESGGSAAGVGVAFDDDLLIGAVVDELLNHTRVGQG